MRGLTRDERAEIAIPVEDALLSKAVCLELVRSGRMQPAYWPGGEAYVATDLGRLALRVCPVDE